MNPAPHRHGEVEAVQARYARRQQQLGLDWRYSRLNPSALWPAQERERALTALLQRHRGPDLSPLRLLEIGCGAGGNLQDLLRWGFAPHHLFGVELLPERHQQARSLLPASVTLWQGDALQLTLPEGGFDLMLQSTVFSSLLDDDFSERLAQAMWRWLRPGGAIIWYDFTVNNPRNPDVRGIPLRRLRSLFPNGHCESQRITLAPPLARAVMRVHPSLYTLFNTLPWLRTHVLAWITKPAP